MIYPHRGLYGRPFINLDNLIDVDGLKALHDEVVFGIAKSGRWHSHFGDGLLEPEKYHDIFIGEREILALPEDNINRKRLLSLPQHSQDRKIFIKMISNAYMGSYNVHLRVADKFANRHLAAHCGWYKENAQHFPRLIAWLNKLDVFESLGRVLIFISEHDNVVPDHRDMHPPDRRHTSEILWLRTTLDKSMYVINSETQERYYFDGHSAFFNVMDVHGVESSSKMTFSIRIDGVYTKEARKKMGIPENPIY